MAIYNISYMNYISDTHILKDFFDEVNLNLSAEEFNKYFPISENLLNKMDLDILQESSQSLSKLNIDQSIIKQSGKEIINTIRKDGINKESKQKIHTIISDMFQKISDKISFRQILENDEIKNIPRDKLTRACLLTVFVTTINTLCLCVLYILCLGHDQIAMDIFSIGVAPIVEESAKQIAIKGDFAIAFSLVFNLYEGSSYVIRGIAGGINAGKIIKARGAVVGMHLLTTAIHKIFSSDKIKEKLHIKTDKESKDKSTLISQIIGMIIHGTWNSLAVFSKKFNELLLK